jgi:hypothetical protein
MQYDITASVHFPLTRISVQVIAASDPPALEGDLQAVKRAVLVDLFAAIILLVPSHHRP